MSNPAELDLVRKALALGLGGCVEWNAKVIDRVAADLARHGLTLLDVRQVVIEYARNGGDVIQIKEVRTLWEARREYWYKAIVPMPELFKKGLFVETELIDPDPELPEVGLLNAHEQK
jgi:hypothetical protein